MLCFIGNEALSPASLGSFAGRFQALDFSTSGDQVSAYEASGPSAASALRVALSRAHNSYRLNSLVFRR
jgi:hypothetical protein